MLPLSFGQVPGAPNGSGAAEILVPGASTTLSVGAKAAALRQALSDRQHQSDKVNVRVASVLFEDGTLWRNGFNGRPDPDHPLRWNMQTKASWPDSARTSSEVSYVEAKYVGSRACYTYQNSDFIPCGCGQYIFSDNLVRCFG